MLTKENIGLLRSANMDIGNLVYAALAGGATPESMIDVAGDDALPAIERYQQEQALIKKAEKKVRAKKQAAPDEALADHIVNGMFKAAKMAYNGKPFDLVEHINRGKRMYYAENQTPDTLISLLTTIKHPEHSTYSGVKGSIGCRVGVFKGKAINMTVRFDANQKSRKEQKEAPVVHEVEAAATGEE